MLQFLLGIVQVLIALLAMGLDAIQNLRAHANRALLVELDPVEPHFTKRRHVLHTQRSHRLHHLHVRDLQRQSPKQHVTLFAPALCTPIFLATTQPDPLHRPEHRNVPNRFAKCLRLQLDPVLTRHRKIILRRVRMHVPQDRRGRQPQLQLSAILTTPNHRRSNTPNRTLDGVQK